MTHRPDSPNTLKKKTLVEKERDIVRIPGQIAGKWSFLSEF